MTTRARILAIVGLAAFGLACSIDSLPPRPAADANTSEAATVAPDLGAVMDLGAMDGAGAKDVPIGAGGADATSAIGGAGGTGSAVGGAGGTLPAGTGGIGGMDVGLGGAGGTDVRPGSGGTGAPPDGSPGGAGGVDAGTARGGTGGAGSGGTTGTGGAKGTGGVTSTGGTIGSGGVTGTGGTTATGGMTGTGGTVGTGGSATGGAGTPDASLDGSPCVPEDDAALCTALGVACGAASGPDNCGTVRNVSCGGCGTCADPIILPAIGGAFSGTTSGTGSRSSGCGGGSAPEKVFAWTPDVSGLATLNTCGSQIDTVLDVATGACGASTTVACNNDSPDWCGVFNPTTSSVALNVVAGTTYYITVDGAGSAAGAFNLTVASAQGSCATPYEIPAAGISAHYYMSGINTDSASCGGSGYDRVHHWRPSTSGTAHVTAVDDYWPATLYVRSGSCKGAEIACDNQTAQWPTNNLSFAVTAGVDYYVWVSHGSYTGQYVNQYTLTVTPPGS